MTVNVLGPVAGSQVTTRPDRSNARGATPTWYIGCSGPDIDDGTIFDADAQNDLIAQLRTAFTNSAIDANGDDDMLWRAIQSAGLRYAVDTGSANAVVAAFAPPVAAIGAGLPILVKIAVDNTTSATIAVDGLSTKAIKRPDGSDVFAGDLKAGSVALMVYSGAHFQLIGLLTVAASSVSASTAPFFPEVLTADGRMTFTIGTGSIVIDTAQGFQHRGLIKYLTTNTILADRTFATAISKTYHLRWRAPGTGMATPAGSYPNGRFVLRDLADSGYNPSALSEASTVFDSTYDDMLLARVVTNGSNVLTVTALANLAALKTSVSRTTTVSSPSATISDAYTVNWARQPTVSLSGWNENVTATNTDGDETLIVPGSITRYGFVIDSYTFTPVNAAYYAPLYTMNVGA